MKPPTPLALPLWVGATLHPPDVSAVGSSMDGRNSSIGDFCSLLATTHPGTTSYPAQSVYVAAQDSYYAADEREVQPACVFTPTVVPQISSFMGLLRASSDRARRPLPFAVRSGGHALFAGAANIQNGVTIDMRSLNSVSLSSDRKTAYIGAGAAFSDVYRVLDEHHVTVQGARIKGIAAGGFVSGGGKAFSGRRYGWSCDNVYAYHVVLADGSVVRASASTHPDLWLALKGGSNNFAIIVEYEMKAFEQGDMWGGTVSHNLDGTNASATLNGLAATFSDFMDPTRGGYDSEAEVELVLSFEAGSFTAGTALFHLQPSPYPPALSPFTRISDVAQEALATTNVSNLVDTFSEGLPSRVDRIFQMVYSFTNTDTAGYLDLFSIFNQEVQAIADTAGLQAQYLLQAAPVTNGTNAMRLTPDQKDVVMGAVTLVYSNSSDETLIQQTTYEIIERQKTTLESSGKLLDFLYLNYADRSQDVFDSWGPGSKAFLRQVSSTYDPMGVFQRQLVGGFKLF